MERTTEACWRSSEWVACHWRFINTTGAGGGLFKYTNHQRSGDEVAVQGWGQAGWPRFVTRRWT